MTNPTLFGLNTRPAASSGSSYNAKRKARSCSFEEEGIPEVAYRRIKSPPFDRRHTCPVPKSMPVPDLMADHSNSNSDEDNDQAMEMDMDDEGDCGMNGTTQIAVALTDENLNSRHEYSGPAGTHNYSFGIGGSGGFGFGPGAEEDEDIHEVSVKEHCHYPSLAVYPSLTPRPHPQHITNQPRPACSPLSTAPTPTTANTTIPTPSNPFAPPSALSTPGLNPIQRSTSPLSVQPFSAGLRNPVSNTNSVSTISGLPTPIQGVFQPTISAPLAANATDIERARSVHGPQCKSIPKLVLSQYPDPMTGEKSMWTVCGDCGSCEMAK